MNDTNPETTVDPSDELYDLPDPITAAVRRQRDNPSTDTLYAWGYVLSELTARVEDIARVLAKQVSTYGHRRILRDDEGGNPAARLQEAQASLANVATYAEIANEAARAYHSAIGHIAVEVDPEVTQ
jgi:hypothetical protein